MPHFATDPKGYPMSLKFLGWKNYETWIVNLEVRERRRSGTAIIAARIDQMDADGCQAFVEEIVDSTTSAGLGRNYARAFLRSVNWDEIVTRLNDADDDMT